MSGQDVLGWATLIVAVVSLVNAATVHYSNIKGTWYGRLLKTLLWATERVSILQSRDTDGVLKLPLTSKPRDGGFVDLSLLLFLALAIFVLTSCASTFQGLETTQTVAEAAGEMAEIMCQPVKISCDDRDERGCKAMESCLKAKVVTLKALKALNDALVLAVMAAQTKDSAEEDRWMAVAVEAMATAQRQLALWR